MKKLAVIGPLSRPSVIAGAASAAKDMSIDLIMVNKAQRIPADCAALLIDVDECPQALEELEIPKQVNLPPVILAARRLESVPDAMTRIAAAVICSPLDYSELLSAIHAVREPRTYIARNHIARNLATAKGIASLTERELEVLLLIAQGCSDTMIARRLYVEVSTIHSHTRHLRAKLGADNRTHAVALAGQYGLLQASGLW